jgi:transcriptional regulator with XRE-family HTH domain
MLALFKKMNEGLMGKLPETPNDRLGAYVARIMEARGLKFADIPKKGGPSKGWVNELVNGQRTDAPKRATLQKLATALGVTEQDIEFVMSGGSSEHPGSLPSESPPSLTLLYGRGPDDHPLTPREKETLNEMSKYPGLGVAQFTQPGFWRMTPDERREAFLLAEQGIESAKRYFKTHGGLS